jgi:hypothetical protein
MQLARHRSLRSRRKKKISNKKGGTIERTNQKKKPTGEGSGPDWWREKVGASS